MMSPSRSLFSVHVFGLAFILLLLYQSGAGHSDGSVNRWLWCVANTAAAPLVGLVLVAIEQATVFAVARALGDRVVRIWIGEGPTVVERVVRDTNILVRVLPMFGGSLILSPKRSRQLLRTAIAQGAGALALASVLVAILVFEHPTARQLQQHLSSGFAFDTLLIFGAMIAMIGGFTGGTHLFSSDEKKLRARRTLAAVVMASEHIRRGAYSQAEQLARDGLVAKPDDPDLQYVLATALICRQQYDEALLLIDGLRGRQLPAAFKTACGAQWAWICYMSDRTSFREPAEKAARDAVAAFPEEPALLDTLGHVLMWNGNLAEAEECLRRAYQSKSARASTRTSAATGLAMVCGKREKIDEAVSWLAIARTFGQHEELVARAAALIEPLRRT